MSIIGLLDQADCDFSHSLREKASVRVCMRTSVWERMCACMPTRHTHILHLLLNSLRRVYNKQDRSGRLCIEQQHMKAPELVRQAVYNRNTLTYEQRSAWLSVHAAHPATGRVCAARTSYESPRPTLVWKDHRWVCEHFGSSSRLVLRQPMFAHGRMAFP